MRFQVVSFFSILIVLMVIRVAQFILIPIAFNAILNSEHAKNVLSDAEVRRINIIMTVTVVLELIFNTLMLNYLFQPYKDSK